MYDFLSWVEVPDSFKYFTLWGVCISETYFSILMIAYIVDYFSKHEERKYKNPYSPFRMWKWVTFLFQTAFLWEIAITTIYWGMLWWYETHSVKTFFNECKDHLMPFLILLTDYIINRVTYELH